MNLELNHALCDLLLAMADDELILAHRNSEWTGHGPILEEDIAFSNIAQDEMGHAILWYGILGFLIGNEPDQMVFFRDVEAFRNVQMVELPNGDWAFSMLRQYLFDTAEMVRLGHLINSSYQPIADAAAKIRQEEIYHLRHTHNWVIRLGLGTDESNQRMQTALNVLWAQAHQLFVPLLGEKVLVENGIFGDTTDLLQEWLKIVRPHLTDSGLQIPDEDLQPAIGRDEHTQYLRILLKEMQEVARLDPEAEW